MLNTSSILGGKFHQKPYLLTLASIDDLLNHSRLVTDIKVERKHTDWTLAHYMVGIKFGRVEETNF
jgi:hypothetical protein